jgi:predicted ATPase/class 3 adenylate cyclase
MDTLTARVADTPSPKPSILAQTDTSPHNAVSTHQSLEALMPAESRTTPSRFPTGTVTFLFTDIEGSTRLWETQRAAMQQALAHHDAIMRDAIESNDGYLVKTTGDGVHAAFAIAADAIAACLAAQRALKARAWGELRIKCRMALHSGAAEQRDGDYYGPALNRAARLMAAAHGGQILLSLATGEMVRDHLPADITLRDMGERRLKDLIGPERVYQLIAPDLPADFPPLKTLDARPSKLPAQTTRFIGREKEVRAIKKQLSDSNVRLLTLSGVGGTGKTRLALQAAAELVDDFEHGVFFVPLAALSDPRLVLPTIAHAFDVREAAGRSLQEQLEEHLREKELLLVLDNFEQVVDSSPIVIDLLTAAPRLKVLATSREVLRLSCETDYPVPPLSLPDPKQLPPLEQLAQYEAVALFTERAVAVKPGFTVTNQNAPAVAGICYRLDGLPLAIELAAAHARVLPPQRMLEELSHRLTFLVDGARDLPARQKTLRGAIDWSHTLLTGDEQRLFRRLGVFVGGCAPEAIETVCNVESVSHVLDTAESLVGKSLLKETEADGEPRFAMLETIREYAGEKLVAAGEEQRVRERHRDTFLALAEDAEPKLKGAEQAQWLQRLNDEHENLRAAFEWCLAAAGSSGGLRLCGALRQFWWMRGHIAEGREWCARALAQAGSEELTQERANVLSAAGGLAYLQADYPAAKARHEESLAIRRELGDQRGIATSLSNLGVVATGQGNFASARALFEESLTILRQLGDPWGIAIALGNLGSAANEAGDYPAAKSRHEESLAIKRKLGNRAGIAKTLESLATLAHAQGDCPTAKALHVESLVIMRELGDRLQIAHTLTNLGAVACDQGEFLSAWELFTESLVNLRELGDRRYIAFALEGLAAVAATLDSPCHAARIWGAAERLRAEIGSPLAPGAKARYDRLVAAARAALGDDAAFSQAWQEGRALTLDQAIELALEKKVPRP